MKVRCQKMTVGVLDLVYLAIGGAVAPLQGADRDKTGTSEGRISRCDSQTKPPAGVTAGGSSVTERQGFEPPTSG